MAVVALDSATERSVHEGQRTPASMADARSPAVWGDEFNAPLPITSATARTTRGTATRAHKGTRAPRSPTRGTRLLRPGRLQEGVEVLLGGRPLEHRGHPAGGIDH